MSSFPNTAPWRSQLRRAWAVFVEALGRLVALTLALVWLFFGGVFLAMGESGWLFAAPALEVTVRLVVVLPLMVVWGLLRDVVCPRKVGER